MPAMFLNSSPDRCCDVPEPAEAKFTVPGLGQYTASDLAAIFTIAVCSMWPTVLNTAVGVRAVPQD